MSYKILVVEDDNQIQELIVEFLSSQGYKVDMANDGVEGYEKFKKDKYDLVILDVMMPKLNGYSLCKMIKNLNKQVSIIFLTALDDEESEIKGFDLDADDYISKPFSFNILVKRVEAVLKRKNKFFRIDAGSAYRPLRACAGQAGRNAGMRRAPRRCRRRIPNTLRDRCCRSAARWGRPCRSRESQANRCSCRSGSPARGTRRTTRPPRRKAR